MRAAISGEAAAITPREFSRLFKIHEATVRRLCVRGLIRAQHVGKLWRIPKEEVKRFLDGGAEVALER